MSRCMISRLKPVMMSCSCHLRVSGSATIAVIVVLLLPAIASGTVTSIQQESTTELDLITTSDEKSMLEIRQAIGLGPLQRNNTLMNWHNTSNICQWIGVTCSNAKTRTRARTRGVVALNLTNAQLINGGFLSPAIGNLSFLENLTLQDTGLIGSIPGELGKLSELKVLDLGGNNFTGSIPKALANCTNLTLLNVSYNHLTGSIPPELGRLRQLRELNFEYNNLTGSIPATLGDSCESLQRLVGRVNILSGSIPASLGNCSQLQDFDFEANQLTGSIPETFGRLQELSRIMARFNKLNGSIGMLGNCSKMQFLYLSYNDLEGSLPPAPGQSWPHLENFEGQNNRFSGIIPEQLAASGCIGLKNLVFGNNNLSGSITPLFGRCPLLESLQFWNNNLTGHISSELGGLQKFRLLYLTDNNLEGPIPGSLATCPALGEIQVGGNSRINGGIPPELGMMKNLANLVISKTSVGGVIPESLGNASSLVTLMLNDNKLSGTIPATLSQCQNLTTLFLHNNQISGVIPAEIGSLPLLKRLWLSNNDLAGPIPESIGRCSQLKDLILTNNRINGTFPASFGDCTKLERIMVANNLLSGELESVKFEQLRSLEVLSLANNFLIGPIPESLRHCVNLTIADFSNNHLHGHLPEFVENSTFPDVFPKLRVLSIDSNQMTGVIPDWIWSLGAVSVLALSNNGFSGEISKNLSKLVGFIDSKNDSSTDQLTSISDRIQLFTSVFDVELNLTFENNKYIFSGETLSTTTALNLENNNLSGNIPGDIVNLKQLRQLYLAGNALSGDIPDAPSALPNLVSLNLSDNQLVGNVPFMLATSSLTVLFLWGNNLSGKIPQVNKFDEKFNNASYLPGNAGLCGWYTNRCPVTPPSSSNPSGLASKESWVKKHVSIPGFVLGLFTGFLGVIIFIRSIEQMRKFVLEPRVHPTSQKSARSRYN